MLIAIIPFEYQEANAEDIIPEGLVFKVSDDGYIIKDYTGTASELIIPSKYNNKDVIYIENGAFMGCTSLESVVIPESVNFRKCCYSKYI